MTDSNNGRRHELAHAGLIPAVDPKQSDLNHDTIGYDVWQANFRRYVHQSVKDTAQVVGLILVE